MPQDDDQQRIDALLQVMAALRTPETGCPWDLEQTFKTIAPYTIEEAYEVADAIDRGDLADLKDELGDLLLQVVYHARLAEEENAFDFGDVTAAITRKMIRRHPHVFGDDDQRKAGAAKGFWERIKAQERAEKAAHRDAAGQSNDEVMASALDGIPHNMPALVRALKLQNKAAKVGFDWPSLEPVMAKMREELAELDEVLAQTDAGRHRDAVKDEFGDLLFVMVNVARHLGIDPEDSLRRTNAKFERRFHSIEQSLNDAGRTASDASLEEMDALWDAAKRAERET